jgi:MoxR-like ATPase
LVRGEEGDDRASGPEEAAIPQEAVLEAREAIRQVTTADTVVDYVVALVTGTRYPEKYGDNLKQWIHVGASPRGTIALDRVSRAHAWLNGQAYVTPDNVRAVIHDCLRHRIMLSYEANADGVTADDVIRELVGQVAVA